MNNEPTEVDYVDSVVNFWAIDDSLDKIRGILKEISKLCEKTEYDDVD